MTQPQPSGFHALPIDPRVLQILDRIQYTVPTPIQEQAIPVAISGQDVIGIAQTGTGKTLAFAIPLMQRLMDADGQALVVVPTRELALQVEETVQKLGRPLQIRSAVLIGGVPIFRQLKDLQHNPRVLVVTPGRLQDHLNQGSVSLSKMRIVVMDEADRMLDMGFAPQIKRIMESVPTDRQTMLFSATMPSEIEQLAKVYQKNPQKVEVARAGTATEQVSQELYIVHREGKTELLEQILAKYEGSVLVFSRTKHGAKKITKHLQTAGHTAAEIHSNRSLVQRKQALDGFKSGRYRVLVATDIAARGIDVTGIELVVNYDLPDTAEDYVHRIGRTGRAGMTGHAISLATPDQGKDIKAIERVINKKLPLSADSKVDLEQYGGGREMPRQERRQSPRFGHSPREPRVIQPREARPTSSDARPARPSRPQFGARSQGQGSSESSSSISAPLKGFNGPRRRPRF